MAVRAFPSVARRASTVLWSSVAAGNDCSTRARESRFQPGYATRGALSQAAAFFSPSHKRSRSIGSSRSIRGQFWRESIDWVGVIETTCEKRPGYNQLGGQGDFERIASQPL